MTFWKFHTRRHWRDQVMQTMVWVWSHVLSFRAKSESAFLGKPVLVKGPLTFVPKVG